MIKQSDIIIKSSFGHNIRNLLLTHEPDVESLAVMFPGGDGVCDVPVLHYARKVALLSPCDVLSVEYGYVRTEHSLSKDLFNNIVEETYEAVNRCNIAKYNQIYFISKSFGTLIAGKVTDSLTSVKIKNLFLTPLEDTIQYMVNKNCVVVIGTKDKFFFDTSKIEKLPNVTLHKIDNAGHSLEMSDSYEKSLEILMNVSKICDDFLHML